jgi:beta-1,4-N-acetylglucosaminyltransferase
MDKIARNLNEDVVMQIGSSTYLPKHTKYFDFVDEETILEYFQNARIIISHAGAGTILNALSLGKIIILVPRLQEYGECCDNQQLEITKVLAESEEAIALYSIDQLESTIKNADSFNITWKPKDKKLVRFLKESIRGMV